MIIVVTGPTAVGKTALSVKLAKHFKAEIINADSMQFYKGLDIGSAKVKEDEKEGVIHHLFDVVNPEEMFSIYDYQKNGRSLLEKVMAQGKNVVIVGGSGLYIKALLYDYELQKNTKNYDFSAYSNEELLDKIRQADSDTDLHVNNRRRLERSYAKILSEDKHNYKAFDKLYDFVTIGLTTDRKTLYEKINKRVDVMFDEGLLNEVRAFYDAKINSKALQTGIGYKELYKYFDGELSLDEAKDLIRKNSRRYAKRQYTFFNNQLDVKWFETNYDNFNETINKVIDFLEKGGN